jgi:hypothetical protein
MRKIITASVSAVFIITAVLFYISKTKETESGIIRNVVLYQPSTKIGDLYNANKSFNEIDRTLPERTLFSKTKVENKTQLEKIYTSSVQKSEMMQVIQGDEASEKYKNDIRQKEVLFSLYYHGSYGPPYWFCFFESPGISFRVPVFLELENDEWRQETDIGKYPVIIAFFDLGKKHGVFNGGKPLTQSDIEAFINDCRNLDDIITAGMAEDPEYYGSVQILK